MGKVLYAAAISAQTNSASSAVAASCIANNKHEAIGRMLDAAKREWPTCDGWWNHQASVVAIERRLLEEVLSADDSEEEKQS